MPARTRARRTATAGTPESVAISASPKPARFASSSGDPTTRDSASTTSASRSVNHGAMPVAAAMAAASVQPWRRRATIRHRRVSDGARNAARSSGGRSARPQAGSSHSQPRPRGSRDRTALSIAGPNSRSMAIASPVAFICTPRLRSADGNLSNGQRGSLTTT